MKMTIMIASYLHFVEIERANGRRGVRAVPTGSQPQERLVCIIEGYDGSRNVCRANTYKKFGMLQFQDRF